MTPEQEALVEALRLFAADQGIGFDRMHNQMAAGLIEPIGEDLCDSTFSVTPAGRLVLALAAERDLLRAERLKDNEEAERDRRRLAAELRESIQQTASAVAEAQENLAERNQLQSDLEAEFEGRTELRRAHGARDDETFGAFFMRIAKERDMWRLRCEWQEAIAVYESAWRRWNTASETGTMNQDVVEWLDTAEAMRDQAKAAYVAAGGVV